MAWRTREGRTSDPAQDDQRRGTQPRRGINNISKSTADACASIFEIEAEREYIRKHGAAYLLYRDDND